MPKFQPELVRFELDPATGAFAMTQRIGLTQPDGVKMTGLPNLQAGAQGTAYTDEVPVDLFGDQLANRPLGIDPEGIVVAPDGTFWMVEEYRVSILHFDATGKLLARYIPEGTAAAVGAPPGTFGMRRCRRSTPSVAPIAASRGSPWTEARSTRSSRARWTTPTPPTTPPLELPATCASSSSTRPARRDGGISLQPARHQRRRHRAPTRSATRPAWATAASWSSSGTTAWARTRTSSSTRLT